ncbi:unnamed protein product [Ectocarpus sp. 12 AP-2014]
MRAAQLPSRQARRSTRCNDTSPNMRYIAMNRFKVKLGCEEDFQTMWRERESKLASFSGFEQFMLLRLDTREAEKKEEEEGAPAARPGYTEFVSHTTWAHQMDFEEWKRSQAFKKSHGGGGGGEGKGKGKLGGFAVVAGGMGKMRELIVEPPVPSLYNAPIVEPVPPEHQGGLWDFEEEPSYFDGDM